MGASQAFSQKLYEKAAARERGRYVGARARPARRRRAGDDDIIDAEIVDDAGK